MTLKKRSNSNLEGLTKKVTHQSINSRFEQADRALGTNDPSKKERVSGKSFTLTKQDFENIKLIKEKCLDKRVVVTDSQVVRLGLSVAAKMSENALVSASEKLTKISAGRPPKEN
jgi:hypothetical protein